MQKIGIAVIAMFSVSIVVDLAAFGILFEYNLASHGRLLVSLGLWMKILSSASLLTASSLLIHKGYAKSKPLVIWIETTIFAFLVQIIAGVLIFNSTTSGLEEGDIEHDHLDEVITTAHLLILVMFLIILIVKWIVCAIAWIKAFALAINHDYNDFGRATGIRARVRQQPQTR